MWWSWLDTGKIKELPSTTNNLVKNVVAAKSCPNHGAPKLNLDLSHKQPEIAVLSGVEDLELLKIIHHHQSPIIQALIVKIEPLISVNDIFS